MNVNARTIAVTLGCSLLSVLSLEARPAWAVDPIFGPDQYQAWLAAGGSCYGRDELHAPAVYMHEFVKAPSARNRSIPGLECWLNSAMGKPLKDVLMFDGDLIDIWSDSRRSEFFIAFAAAWKFFESGFGTSYHDFVATYGKDLRPQRNGQGYIVNEAAVRDPSGHATAFSESNAWRIWVGHVAFILAGELGNWYRWSLRTYDEEQLRSLLDSRFYFYRSSIYDFDDIFYLLHGGGIGTLNTGEVSPEEAHVIFNHLRDMSQGSTASGGRGHGIASIDYWTVDNLLSYVRDRLAHFTGDLSNANYQRIWGYYGLPPVSAMMKRVVDDGAHPTAAWQYTAGCHGTAGFVKAMLRVANIPVDIFVHQGHAIPKFPTVGVYITHGDDPYDRLWRDHSVEMAKAFDQPLPIQGYRPYTENLLRPIEEYQQYFYGGETGAGLGDPVAIAHDRAVGYGAMYAARDNLADWARINGQPAASRVLLQRYCDDLDSGANQLQGRVAEVFKYYTFDHPYNGIAQYVAPWVTNELAYALGKVNGGCAEVRSFDYPKVKGAFARLSTVVSGGVRSLHLRGTACAKGRAAPVVVSAWVQPSPGQWVHLGEGSANVDTPISNLTAIDTCTEGWLHNYNIKLDTALAQRHAGARLLVWGIFSASVYKTNYESDWVGDLTLPATF